MYRCVRLARQERQHAIFAVPFPITQLPQHSATRSYSIYSNAHRLWRIPSSLGLRRCSSAPPEIAGLIVSTCRSDFFYSASCPVHRPRSKISGCIDDKEHTAAGDGVCRWALRANHLLAEPSKTSTSYVRGSSVRWPSKAKYPTPNQKLHSRSRGTGRPHLTKQLRIPHCKQLPTPCIFTACSTKHKEENSA